MESGGNGKVLVKRHKISVYKINFGDIMYRKVTGVNNAVLYTCMCLCV